ncbi:MAG: hypothetical protein SangKO_011120 [Sandaracinaceae bacterium]
MLRLSDIARDPTHPRSPLGEPHHLASPLLDAARTSLSTSGDAAEEGGRGVERDGLGFGTGWGRGCVRDA